MFGFRLNDIAVSLITICVLCMLASSSSLADGLLPRASLMDMQPQHSQRVLNINRKSSPDELSQTLIRTSQLAYEQ